MVNNGADYKLAAHDHECECEKLHVAQQYIHLDPAVLIIITSQSHMELSFHVVGVNTSYSTLLVHGAKGDIASNGIFFACTSSAGFFLKICTQNWATKTFFGSLSRTRYVHGYKCPCHHSRWHSFK